MGTLLNQASSLNHLLNNEHELQFDHRNGPQNQHDESDGTNAVITDDEDCATGTNGINIHDDIAD